MAGHSKWANIKHRKGTQDAARAKLFAKLAKEIMIAATKGGADIHSNAALRLAISKAKAKSMPKINIENAIKKGSGFEQNDTRDFKEIVYSGNLRHGIILLIICLSNNYNRVSSEIQHLFKKANGSIGKQGSIPYIFERKGILEIDITNKNIKELELLILESNVLDLELDKESVTIYTNPSDFDSIKTYLEKNGYTDFITSEITFVSSEKIKLSKENTEQFIATIEKFEENDDVQEIYHNVDLSELKC